MSEFQLTSRDQAPKSCATLFLSGPTQHATLEVREDKCFHPGWLELGKVHLRASETAENGETADQLVAQAIKYGFYELHVRSKAQLEEDLLQLVDEKCFKRVSQTEKLKRSLVGLTHAMQRVGLLFPAFDPGALGSMPFLRPVTIVADTNAVLQGGLDFAARFLSPAARLKVPAVVQMEVLTWVDNYFRIRRHEKVAEKAGSALYDHMRGQGAQRALLRLELMMQTEVERIRFGADPLRGIVQLDTDKEHENLGLQVVLKSFADRLIFETAMQHLHASSPGHPVILMTSDQGLARMALSEGMEVICFTAAQLDETAESVLSGTGFHPFSQKMTSIPLPSLLWELAVTFGSCRLSKDGSTFEVHAMGEDFPWTPYHAKEDILWTRLQMINKEATNSHTQAVKPESPPISNATEDTASELNEARLAENPELESVHLPEQTASVATDPRPPAYKFSPKTLLHLIQLLASKERLTTADVMRTFNFNHERKVQEYRGFLFSAGLVAYDGTTIQKTDDLDVFWAAVKNGDLTAAANIALRVPSLEQLYGSLAVGRPTLLEDAPIRSGASSNYRCMLELLGLALEIAGDGLYQTPNSPIPSKFAEAAYDVYQANARSEGKYIATGIWLEDLAKRFGIHPLVSRRRLEEARLEGLLERYVEGSTPDTRFARHTFCMVEFRAGEVTVKDVALFEGDFLLPGKSSASLRLKRPAS
jgi:hypothetical protein